MAKRELSSTLKNLKFMQRAVQKEEKVKKEDASAPGDSPSCSAARRCIVIMEGDPHPGATSGRMSFLSFNPSIDKLNQETSGLSENNSAAPSSSRQEETTPTRENASSQHRPNSDMEMDSSNGDLKRKQAEVTMEANFPNKTLKNNQGNHHGSSSPTSSSSWRHSQKQQKREKLDWSVLRPPKPQSKKR